jgi:hypothetical protein
MTDCGACIYTGDFDAPDFYERKNVKARKPHHCKECHREIPVGEVYECVSGKWDGTVSTFCTCAECQDIATALSCDGNRMHGGLWEALEDLGPDVVGPGCLARLSTAAAKQKLRNWWIERKGL